MKQQILDFLISMKWIVNNSRLIKLESQGKTFYAIGMDFQSIVWEDIFTLENVIEIDLDFEHRSAKIWTED